MNTSPLVSLILVTYNSRALLEPFFAALGETRYAPYEVIVVDNASTDETVAYLTTQQPQVRVLAHPANLGFGRACNQGARIARGDLLIFLNPDVIVTPGWLEPLVQDMAAYPQVGIMCPATLYPDQSPSELSGSLRELATVPGCAMVVRRAAWEELCGFDEHMFLYWEDTDLCWRAWLQGWRVVEDQRSFVYHERGGSTRGRRWDAELTKNSLYSYLKLMRWRRVIPFALLLAAKTLVKLLLLRDPALLQAWGWNARHLGETLRRRRSLTRRNADLQALERMIDRQNRRLALERRARRRLSTTSQ